MPNDQPDAVSAEVMIKVLLKQNRHDLLYDLARLFAELLIAGPWCGPLQTSTNGKFDPALGRHEALTIDQWFRPIPDPRKPSSAAIILKSPNPDDPSRPYEWFALPRDVDPFNPADRKKGSYQYSGKTLSLVEAQNRVDRILIEEGYALDGRRPGTGPWQPTAAGNPSCYRDFTKSSCLRSPEGLTILGYRAIIVRPTTAGGMNPSFTWAILHPHANDKTNAIAASGTARTSSEAKNAADTAARERGWDVPL